MLKKLYICLILFTTQLWSTCLVDNASVVDEGLFNYLRRIHNCWNSDKTTPSTSWKDFKKAYNPINNDSIAGLPISKELANDLIDKSDAKGGWDNYTAEDFRDSKMWKFLDDPFYNIFMGNYGYDNIGDINQSTAKNLFCMDDVNYCNCKRQLVGGLGFSMKPENKWTCNQGQASSLIDRQDSSAYQEIIVGSKYIIDHLKFNGISKTCDTNIHNPVYAYMVGWAEKNINQLCVNDAAYIFDHEKYTTANLDSKDYKTKYQNKIDINCTGIEPENYTKEYVCCKFTDDDLSFAACKAGFNNTIVTPFYGGSDGISMIVGSMYEYLKPFIDPIIAQANSNSRRGMSYYGWAQQAEAEADPLCPTINEQ
jgi:hypothetical protein